VLISKKIRGLFGEVRDLGLVIEKYEVFCEIVGSSRFSQKFEDFYIKFYVLWA
jgi:hypothetical protein